MIFVTDDIGQVVQYMRSGIYSAYSESTFTTLNGAPHYLFGHVKEINGILSRKNKDSIKKDQKYPLIAMKWETSEQVRGDMRDMKLNLIIADYTDRNYMALDRMNQVFKPILYPLYYQFLNAITNSGIFTWEGDELYPPHTMIPRPYYGTQTNLDNKKNIFDDPIDAIEIIDLQVSRVDTRC